MTLYCVVGRKAIRLLKEERHNLEIKLKTITCNKNVKDGEKYKAKFAQLIREIKKSEIEFNEERKIEMEIDKEILRLEIGQNKPENRIKMGNVKKIVFGVNIFFIYSSNVYSYTFQCITGYEYRI
jgi:hypothetical protein